MNPQQAEAWVASILRVRRVCGHETEEKRISQAEVESLLSLTRGTYACRPIEKGEGIRKDMVFFAMPCRQGQTTSGEYQETMIASRDYGVNEAIRERRSPDPINMMRGIIHDAKGMLYEANIEIGTDFTIELSHHHGMEHFRQTGALIFNIVNRDYCKKIIVMLPGQFHPVHYHKTKEETFHVLWGDLEVELNKLPVPLRRGDKLLIQRGARHAFMSRSGAIFEEISTYHAVDDSYYDDPAIAGKDPIQRKTIIDDW
jgi:N-acetylneuraminate synthase